MRRGSARTELDEWPGGAPRIGAADDTWLAWKNAGLAGASEYAATNTFASTRPAMVALAVTAASRQQSCSYTAFNVALAPSLRTCVAAA